MFLCITIAKLTVKSSKVSCFVSIFFISSGRAVKKLSDESINLKSRGKYDSNKGSYLKELLKR